MDMTFTARFVHSGYYLEALEGERRIEDLIANVLPKGAIVEITIKAKTTGETRGFCEVITNEKYGTHCGRVLSAAGKCPTDEHNGVTAETVSIGPEAVEA